MRFSEFSMPRFSADVIEKIRDYRHSLETLHLDLRDVIESSPSYRPDCTFHDFEKLEHVFLNTRLVFHTLRDLEGIDGPTVEDRHAITRLLPPSIVSLHLVWDGLEIDRLEQGLMGLVGATTDRFQHLKLVGLDYAERLDETVHHAMLELVLSSHTSVGQSLLRVSQVRKNLMMNGWVMGSNEAVFL
ncbi:hypothetical protein FOQG_14564 [Fusarium oxysporum f. sp. raphani 54005]|uniref:Uncharacterized protein n=1 Tax=Fusarium oxysporum f. sp. raphani 54005 TaxID=1089458 RepID=X0BR47_FUSOX|nr:hypothetical protein FOQG_14564 [Fusarium oxysporum f. sp. raphani 54005]